MASAPAVFQGIMNTLLKDLSSVVAYLDDILIVDKTKDEYLRNLEAVLPHLTEREVRIKKAKC